MSCRDPQNIDRMADRINTPPEPYLHADSCPQSPNYFNGSDLDAQDRRCSCIDDADRKREYEADGNL